LKSEVRERLAWLAGVRITKDLGALPLAVIYDIISAHFDLNQFWAESVSMEHVVPSKSALVCSGRFDFIFHFKIALISRYHFHPASPAQRLRCP